MPSSYHPPAAGATLIAEMTNLAGDPAHAGTVAYLSALLAAHVEDRVEVPEA